MGSAPNTVRSQRKHGFSLIDLLVSIAVMVVLISILAPSLFRAQESARRVRCASNVRQIGIAIQTYASDYRDRLPPAWFNESNGSSNAQSRPDPNQNHDQDSAAASMQDWSNDTMFVRVVPDEQSGRSSQPVWDGLGVLIADRYLDHPGVFYCPSHHGDHDFHVYAGQWTGGMGSIAANYQYRIPADSAFLSELDPRLSISADGMRTRDDYNHVDGNNFLRADLSVGWYADIGNILLNSLPNQPAVTTTTMQPNRGWEFFDATI